MDKAQIFKDFIVLKHLSGLKYYGHDKQYHLSRMRKRVEFLGHDWEKFLLDLDLNRPANL